MALHSDQKYANFILFTANAVLLRVLRNEDVFLTELREQLTICVPGNKSHVAGLAERKDPVRDLSEVQSVREGLVGQGCQNLPFLDVY